MDRKRFCWNVTLAAENGQQVVHTIRNYWDPEKPETAEAIGRTARAEAYMANGKREFLPIVVERADPATV